MNLPFRDSVLDMTAKKEFLGLKVGTKLKMTPLEEIMFIYEFSRYIRACGKCATNKVFFRRLVEWIGLYNAIEFCREKELDPFCLNNLPFRFGHKQDLRYHKMLTKDDLRYYAERKEMPEKTVAQRLAEDPELAAAYEEDKQAEIQRDYTLSMQRLQEEIDYSDKRRPRRWLFRLVILVAIAILIGVVAFIISPLWDFDGGFLRQMFCMVTFLSATVLLVIPVRCAYNILIKPKEAEFKIDWSLAFDDDSSTEAWVTCFVVAGLYAILGVIWFFVCTEIGVYVLMFLVFAGWYLTAMVNWNEYVWKHWRRK